MKRTLFYKILKLTHWHWVYYRGECADLIREYYYDRKFNIHTSGKYFETDQGSQSLFSDETEYMPTSYFDLKKVLAQLELKSHDVFLDIGCGKARVVFLAAAFPIKKAIGIELRKSVYENALNNAKNMRFRKAEIEFLHGDATQFNYDEITIFYFFNPFGIKTFTHVMEKIHQSILNKPRNIQLVYYAVSGRTEECQMYINSLSWLKLKSRVAGTRIPVSIYSNS